MWQLALAALVEREVSDELGEGGNVAQGHPDDHAPTANAGTEAPKEGDKRGESHGAEPALPGLHVLTEIKLHVSSGLRVKVIGSAATTAGGVRERRFRWRSAVECLLLPASLLDCVQRVTETAFNT